MEWYAAAIGIVVAFGAWCIFRVRREYLRVDRLSTVSIASVWILYVSHFFVTAVAATTSRWPLPVHPMVAFVSGIFFLGAGALLFVGGIASFRSFRRMSGMDTSTLVTTGAYRWSRNPQNVGWALFLVGTALLGRSGLALFMAALFWVTFYGYVSAEEKFLERLFGEEYRRYQAWSHRYLGRPHKAAF